jgi:hypothetical protein
VANVAQMAINDFWNSVVDLQANAEYEQAVMDDTRQKLIVAYSDARNDPDPARAASRMAALDPVVHQNSAIRLKYRDLVGAFNQAVNGAKALIQKAGLTVPNQLSGLGQIETVTGIVIVGVAVAALGTAWLILNWIKAANKANVDATDATIAISNDTTATPEQRAAARDAITKRTAAPPPPGGFFDVSSLIPLAGLVALIVLGPKILDLMPKRKGAAA